MIIHIQSDTTENATAAQKDLDDLTTSWGHPLTHAAIDTGPNADAPPSADKVVDLVAIAALVLSLPSAALAVSDITDRIQKRRRAHQLIHHAQQLTDHNTTVTLVTPQGHINLAHLDPDQLLDLWPTDDPPT